MKESLTPQEEQQLVEARDYWFKIGTMSGPADIEACRPAINHFYSKMDQPAPEIIRVASPVEAAKLAGEDSYQDKYVECQQYAYWIGYYDFLNNLEGVPSIEGELKEDFDHAKTLCMNSGWVFPYEGICYVTDRPEVVYTDADVPGATTTRQLHNETGPVRVYPDGTMKIYYLDGVEVPEKAVMAPESITVEDVKNEQNAEVKRILRERYGNTFGDEIIDGTGKYLFDIGAKPIDQDLDFHGGGRGLIEDDEGNKWLQGSDGSTGRVYVMRVPSNVNTCKEAHESLWQGLGEGLRVGQS